MGGSLRRQLNTCFEVNSVMTKWTDDSMYDETRGRNSVVTIRDTCAEANSIVGNEAGFNEPCDTLTRGYIRTLFIVVAPRALYAACSTSDSVSWRPTRWKQFHRCIFFNGNPEINTGKPSPRKKCRFYPPDDGFIECLSRIELLGSQTDRLSFQLISSFRYVNLFK